MNRRLISSALAVLLGAVSSPAVEFPGTDPGEATARLENGRLVLENAVLGVAWQVAEGRFRLTEVRDRISDRNIRPQGAEAFRVVLGPERTIPASSFRLAAAPSLERIEPRPEAVRAAERFAGWRATARLVLPEEGLRVRWQATLRDGSNYAGQQVTLAAEGRPCELEAVVLVDLDVSGGDGPRTDGPRAKAAGTVSGSPVVAGNLFFACEHPLADNRVEAGRVVCGGHCRRTLQAGKPWTRTSVIGVVPPGQLRRGFLYYLERERARPYQLFLHYNSWWDIAGGGRKMNEKECLQVIDIFGRELVNKRGVGIDSFVFDDGWDDSKSLWRFHDGFPRGFAPLRDAARKIHSAVGVWLSPWGGYGRPKAERLKYGKTQGFETNARGFSLAGATYYGRFAQVCRQMISKYGVNYFKFDGIAQGINSDDAGDEYAADVEALLRLAGDLRRLRPDVYLSMTTGTWPSPYWLWYGDSVWRNGNDVGFQGAGSMRQQSITYRDMITRRMIVDRAPLYPLNSLMIVSVCYARLGLAAKITGDPTDRPADLADEIRMGFAGGTQLLELYVTPQMMTPRGWDTLAECAHWARQNADVLVDSHWVGGDPGKGQPYGYAAWSPRKGILVLRNPGDAPQAITLNLAAGLELPSGAAGAYRLGSRWARPGREVTIRLEAREPHTFELEPFEVLLLEATPAE